MHQHVAANVALQATQDLVPGRSTTTCSDRKVLDARLCGIGIANISNIGVCILISAVIERDMHLKLLQHLRLEEIKTTTSPDYKSVSLSRH
jgi:hypothetical protein